MIQGNFFFGTGIRNFFQGTGIRLQHNNYTVPYVPIRNLRRCYG